MAQPGGARQRPCRAWMITRAYTKIMSSRSINVQLRRNAGFLQGQIHQCAVLRRADNVVSAVCEKDRRRPDRNTQVGSDLVFILCFQETRIDSNGEVGPATESSSFSCIVRSHRYAFFLSRSQPVHHILRTYFFLICLACVQHFQFYQSGTGIVEWHSRP